MQLNYKASNIARVERESKITDPKNPKKFFTALNGLGGEMSVDDLLFLFVAGGGTEDQFDQLFAEKGVQEIILVIMEGINDAGFLGKKIDVAEIRKAMEAAVKGDSSKATPTTGESTKA